MRLATASRPADLSAFAEAGRRVYGSDFRRAYVADTEDGVLHAAILHRGAAAFSVTDEDDRVRARTQRSTVCDLVRWDAVNGRASFSLAIPLFLVEWRDALAAAAGVPLRVEDLPWTLKLLHERGSAVFAKTKLPPGVLSVEVVACELDDGTRLGARGAKALDALHARFGHGGYIWRATFRFVIAGAPRPVDATIELPNKLLLSEPRWEPVIRAAFQALGLTEPGVLADDLASLAPFVHPEWRWVSLLGRTALDRARAEKVPVRRTLTGQGEPRAIGSGGRCTRRTISKGRRTSTPSPTTPPRARTR